MLVEKKVKKFFSGSHLCPTHLNFIYPLHRDIIENYLSYNRDLKIRVIVETNVHRLEAEALEYNLALSIAFCRLHYLRVPEPIPSTIEGYANYWKTHYNTYLGAGTVEEFIENYKKYAL